MADPASASTTFPSPNSAIKLAEHAVESENGVFARLIQRVRLDLEETKRLLYVPLVKEKLINTPGKLPWIKDVIISAKSALNDIGRWVDRVTVDKEGYGSDSWENRVRWVFNDHDKLATRRMELETSHRALLSVLSYLAPLEQTETPVDAAPPQYDDATFFDNFLTPRQKRRKAWDTEKDEGTFNETDGVISPRPLDPSSNWVFPQALPSANPPPSYQLPTSQAPQSFEGTNTCMSSIHPRNTPSHQYTSSTLLPVSCPKSLQQFSATNFLGPVDPFGLFAGSGAQASSVRSQDVRPVAVESFFAIQHPISLRGPPVPPKVCQSSTQTNTIAEMMGDISFHHPENHSSLAKIPKNISIAQSLSTDSFHELPVGVPSWEEMPAFRSKMPGDAINRRATWSASATEASAELYSAVERSRNPPQFGSDTPTSDYAEMPSHAISQVPQASQQYPPSTTSWSSIQLQTQTQLQPKYQSQYQPCRSPIPTLVFHTSFLNPISTTKSSPISWQEQQQQTDHTPISPPTQETTAASTPQQAASAVEKEYSLSRPTTLREARRRNQKALLDLMGH